MVSGFQLRAFTVIIFVICFRISWAQSEPRPNETYAHQLDSISKRLPALTGEAKVDALNFLADLYHDKLGEDDKALPPAEQAFRLAKELSYKKGIAESRLNLGRIKLEERAFEEAEDHFGQGIFSLNQAKRNSAGKFDEIKLPYKHPELGTLIGNLYSGLARSYRERLNFSKAATNYASALLACELTLDTLKEMFAARMQAKGLKADKSSLSVADVMDYVKKFPDDKEAAQIAAKGSEANAGIRWASLALGNLYGKMKDYNQALIYLKKAEKNAEEVKSGQSRIEIVASIGDVFFKMHEFDSAAFYYKKLIAVGEEIQIIQPVIEALQRLGQVYREQKKYDLALESYEKVDQALKPLSDGTYKNLESYRYLPERLVTGGAFHFRTGVNLKQIGDIYTITGKNEIANERYRAAIQSFSTVLEIKKRDKDTLQLLHVQWMMGKTYSALKQHDLAMKQFAPVIQFYESKFHPEDRIQFLKDLQMAYDAKGDAANAYKYYQRYIALKDSVYSQQNANEMAELQKRLEVEKKDADIELLTRIQEAKEVELEKQRLVRNGFIAGTCVLLLLAFVIFRSLQANKKAKKVIEVQKKLVEEKNKEITDSIRYAQRIQNALMPGQEFVRKTVERLKGS